MVSNGSGNWQYDPNSGQSGSNGGIEPVGNAYDPGFQGGQPAFQESGPQPYDHGYGQGGSGQGGYGQGGYGQGGHGPGYTAPLNVGSIPPGTPIPVSAEEFQAERSMAGFMHWGAIFLGWVAGVIGLVAKPASGGRYQEIHAKESLNFSIVMLIGYTISGVLSMVVIGFFMILGLLGFDIYQRIKATGAADRGEMPNYWLPFRVIN